MRRRVNPSISLLKAIGDGSRFRIVEMLLVQDLCVGALARRVGLSDAAVSQHLQVLRKAGLVRGEKRGYWTHYTVEREALSLLGSELGAMADRGPRSETSCFRMFQGTEGPTERRTKEMCCKDCCEHPEKLKGKPEECTPEQIKECHGDVEDHPCEAPKS
jgi:DNA-binding transcriptional ArsR family regulator